MMRVPCRQQRRRREVVEEDRAHGGDDRGPAPLAWDSSVVGPLQARPSVPSPTVIPNSPTSTGAPRTFHTRRALTRRWTRRMSETTTPSANTGSAGDRNTTTRTTAAGTATTPRPQRERWPDRPGRRAHPGQVPPAHAPMTHAVTIGATTAAGHIRAKKAPPESG